MCVGKCSRCVGLCLVILSLLSITVNLFLLFPNLDVSYMQKNLISCQARRMPGIWTGGLMVFLAGVQITLAGFKMRILSCCGPRCDMLLSVVCSCLASAGAAICFFISSAGLVNGPFCLYKVNGPDGISKEKWGYPFTTPDPQVFNSSAHNYLLDVPLWSSVCIEPPHIVPWNVGFYTSLCLISMLQILLSLIQFINALLGVVGGHCDPRKETGKRQQR
ncbi:transmembrane 4 L6 family member 19 [Ascaphus truei]|uniref:transmembrane 4 L6 family member 19 n=1 Tax=Ascaphus truei TaxID=8439 RepID=UPI003F5A9117